MADTTLILGLAGLFATVLGTVSGAAIGARASASLERRREKREDRQQMLALRTAARLVRADLAMSNANLTWAILRNQWHPDKVRLPLGAWRTHGAALATGVDAANDWDKVYRAHAVLDHLLTGSLALLEPGQALNESLVLSFREANRLVLAADEVLRPLTGHEPGEGEDPTPPSSSERIRETHLAA